MIGSPGTTNGREEGPEKEAHQAKRDGAADNARLQPENQLEADADSTVHEEHAPFPEPVGRLGQEETPGQEATLVARRNVSHLRKKNRQYLVSRCLTTSRRARFQLTLARLPPRTVVRNSTTQPPAVIVAPSSKK